MWSTTLAEDNKAGSTRCLSLCGVALARNESEPGFGLADFIVELSSSARDNKQKTTTWLETTVVCTRMALLIRPVSSLLEEGSEWMPCQERKPAPNRGAQLSDHLDGWSGGGWPSAALTTDCVTIGFDNSSSDIAIWPCNYCPLIGQRD